MSIQSNQGGFSLLEILIASVLFAVIGITVIGLTQSTIKTRDEILISNRDDSQIEIVFSQIERDFAHIYTPIYFDYMPDKKKFIQNNSQFSQRTNSLFPIPSFVGDSHHFIFYSNSNRRKMADVEQSQFTWIQYQLINGALKRFVFPEDPYSAQRINIDEIRGDTMMENIKELQFAYWEPTQKKYIDRLWEHVKYPLRSIRVSINWINNKNVEQSSTRIFNSLWPAFTPTPPKNLQKNNNGNNNSLNPGDDAFDNPFSGSKSTQNQESDESDDDSNIPMFN